MIWLFLVWLLIGIVAVYKAVKAQHLIEKNRMEREQEKPTNQLAGASQAVSVSASAPRPTAAVQQRTPTPPKAREEHAYEAYWHIFNRIECDQSLKERICSEYLPALLANEDRLCQNILEGELMLADWTWLWFEEWRRRFEAAGKWPNAWVNIERQAVRRPASLNAALTFVKMHDIRRILKNKGLEKVPTNRAGVEQMAQQHLVAEDLEDAVADRWQELEANRIRYNKHAMIELIHRSIAHTFENLPVIEEADELREMCPDLTLQEIIVIEPGWDHWEGTSQWVIEQCRDALPDNLLPPYYPGDWTRIKISRDVF